MVPFETYAGAPICVVQRVRNNDNLFLRKFALVRVMKMLAEYLEKAITFERMAAEEENPKLRADLKKQAEAYRKLAAERAKRLGLQRPPGQRT